MPYTNDAQTLAQIVGGPSAAYESGVDQGNQDYAAQIKNQVAAGQAPAEIARPGLQNLSTQAQTEYQQAMGQGQQLKNIETAGTLGSGINATNAGNQLKMTQDQVGKLQTIGQMAGQIAGMMDGVPAVARPAAMQQILQQYKIDPQSLGPLANGDPQMLRQASQSMIQASSQYQTELMKENQATARSTAVAGISANARVTGAEAAANARVQAANITAKMREQQQTFEQAAVQADKAGNHALAQQYGQAALQMRQAQAGITSQLVTGQSLQMPQFGPQGSGQQAPGQSQGAPQATGGAAPSPADVEAEMKRRGLIK